MIFQCIQIFCKIKCWSASNTFEIHSCNQTLKRFRPKRLDTWWSSFLRNKASNSLQKIQRPEIFLLIIQKNSLGIEVERAGNFNSSSWAEPEIFSIWWAELSRAGRELQNDELSWAELARAKWAEKWAEKQLKIRNLVSQTSCIYTCTLYLYENTQVILNRENVYSGVTNTPASTTTYIEVKIGQKSPLLFDKL